MQSVCELAGFSRLRLSSFFFFLGLNPLNTHKQSPPTGRLFTSWCRISPPEGQQEDGVVPLVPFTAPSLLNRGNSHHPIVEGSKRDQMFGAEEALVALCPGSSDKHVRL